MNTRLAAQCSMHDDLQVIASSTVLGLQVQTGTRTLEADEEYIYSLPLLASTSLLTYSPSQ